MDKDEFEWPDYVIQRCFPTSTQHNMMLHPGVEAHDLVDIKELAQEVVRFDPSQYAEEVDDPEQLLEAFDRKLQRGRNKALALLPLLPGTEMSWTGVDIFNTTSIGAIASLFDPDAGDPIAVAHDNNNAFSVAGNRASACFSTLNDKVIPPKRSLRLVCPLGVSMSAKLPASKDFDLDELPVINQFQVWQVEVVQDGIMQHQKLVLKLYDDRVRTFVRTVMNIENESERNRLYDGRTLACNEAAAYQKLRNLQGSLIPRSYGTYEFELPDGQGLCLGMLTEYIEDVNLGTHVYRTLRDQGDAGVEHMVALAAECDEAVRKLVDLQVIPRHINSSSVKYDPASGSFTFIGLSSSEPEFRPRERHQCKANLPFLQAIREMEYPDREKESELIRTLRPVFRAS